MFSWSDAHSGVKGEVDRTYCRWNGGTKLAEYDGTVAIPEGKNALEVTCEDNAWTGSAHDGNVSTISGEFWLDNTNPVVILDGPAQTDIWLDTPLSVTWSAVDPNGSNGSDIAPGFPTLQWDSGAQVPVDASGSIQIPEGKHSATIRANDVAGNSASQSGGRWWIDTAVPVLAVTLNPTAPNGENEWYTVEPMMSVAAVDPNGADASGIDSLFCSIDGTEEPYTSGVTITGDGIHPCIGRATDVAGNSGQDAIEVKVDTSAPILGSTTTNTVSMSLSTLSASWEFTDPTSGIAKYEYSIYHEAGESDELVCGPEATDQPWAYETNLGLTSGDTYYFRVRAMNNAGLWSDYMDSDPILAVEGTHDTSPSFDTGGVSVPEEARTSPNFRLVDSIGLFVVNTSSSPNYYVEHGYWHSDVTAVPVADIYSAKGKSDGTEIALGSAQKPVVVTVAPLVFGDRFYVEQPDRSSGIAVQLGFGQIADLQPGDRVRINGTMATIDGERVIRSATATFISQGDPLGPLFVNHRWLGGGDLNDQTLGVSGMMHGLHNIGLLIKTSGKISQVDPSGAYFYIDDGSSLRDGTMTDMAENVGVRVLGDGRAYAPDTFVTVTGISSCFTDGGSIQRLISPVSITEL